MKVKLAVCGAMNPQLMTRKNKLATETVFNEYSSRNWST